MKISGKEAQELLVFVRAAVTAAVRGEEPPPAPAFALLQEPRGAFVTLKRRGHLRGCIGHIVTSDPLSRTIPLMAAAAALEDPRFDPVSEEELAEIEVELSVLTEPRPVKGIADVRPGVDGIIVRGRGRSGVYLPQVATETGWNADEFVRHCLAEKAGLPPDAIERGQARLEVFQADVYRE